MDPQFLSHLLTLPDDRPHVHGFHPYPARFSPSLVASLLADVKAESVIFDPFAGSGTTLVEARLRGCKAWGNDLNPIAVLLCRVKADPLPPKAFLSLRGDLSYLRKYILGRLDQRDERERIKLPPGERMFEPHVYWELQAILGGVERVRHPHNQEIFLASLSAIINRVSSQAKDSQPDQRRVVQTGFKRTAHYFFEAAEKVISDLETFSRRARGGELRVWQGDARELPGVPENKVDVIVTSPPYGGTYDYAEMHAQRNLWLGLDWKPFEQFEIGARRRQKNADPLATFQTDLEKVFRSLARVSKTGAALYWVIADGVMDRKAYRGDELSRKAAEKMGWKMQNTGAVNRPVWSNEEKTAYGKEGKREYVMEFTKA
jgi:hypothetical protein